MDDIRLKKTETVEKDFQILINYILSTFIPI